MPDHLLKSVKKTPNNEYCVVLSEPLSTSLDSTTFGPNFTFINAPFRPATRFFSLKSHNSFLKKAERTFKPDVVFTTSGPSYWRPKSPHLMGYNIPHYVYGESPYFRMIGFKKKIWWFLMKRFAYLNFKYNADAYVVQTDDVGDRLKSFIKESKIFTVYNTVNSHYLNPISVENKLPERKNSKEFRLLTLSAYYPHKNLSIVKEVVANLRAKGVENIKFILTIDDAIFKREKFNDYEEITNLGKIKIEEAASLYQECDVMFLPTLLECFSASYVEAMQMKKPILTSDLGFAHTICKNAALYFDPVDPESISTKIIELVNSETVYNRLIDEGTEQLKVFGSAENRAKRYLEICNSLFNEASY